MGTETLFKFDNENHWFSVLLEMPYIMSTNALYEHIGRKTIDKTETKRQREIVREQLMEVDPIGHCGEWLTTECRLRVDIECLVKTSIDKRDVDNMIKNVLDAVFSGLGELNDSQVYEVYCAKSECTGNKEYARVIVSESKHNPKKYVE